MRECAREYFAELLTRHGGNCTAAMREAGLVRKMFYLSLHRVQLDPRSFRKAKAAPLVHPETRRWLMNAVLDSGASRRKAVA